MSFREFLKTAESFLEEAETPPHSLAKPAVRRHCSASLIFSWIALEAFVGDMMADFAALPKGLFSFHERAFLEERALEFITEGSELGQFQIANRPEFRRIDEKIMFLITKFGEGTVIDKGSTWWQKFEASKDKRNKIVHPRKDMPVTVLTEDARSAIAVAKEVIGVVSLAVWGKKAKF
ncbi:MAG: hypothetical protein IIA91_07910 [Chloroflexi bacterium]|nr:hypothetical protein [Chloroflexota bacterium]